MTIAMTLRPWAVWLVRHRVAWAVYAVLLLMAPPYLIARFLIGAALGAAEGCAFLGEAWRELAGHIRYVKSSKP